MNFFQHYYQSGKGYASSTGLQGKSLLTIEWTNQHGCGDRDLNCNFVLQYRCQDDTKHQKLNHHTMRNGKKNSCIENIEPNLNIGGQLKVFVDRNCNNLMNYSPEK
jgi:hypothetical protein